MNNPNPIIRIGVIGFNRRTLHSINIYFKVKCEGRYKLSREHKAQILLIDLDSPESMDLWADHKQRFPMHPTIALSVEKHEVEGASFLCKPLDFEELTVAIEQATGQLPAQLETLPLKKKKKRKRIGGAIATKPSLNTARAFTRALESTDDPMTDACGNAPDIDPDDTESLQQKVFFQPSALLMSLIQQAFAQATKEKKPIRLNAFSRQFTLLPVTHKILCGMKDREMRHIAIVRSDDNHSMETLRKSEADLLSSAPEERIQRLDTFLWKLTLRSARGRVPEGTDLNAPMFLRHWPNFTRLPIIPHSLRIAALWAYQPHSLLDTARVLHIPQRYVFAFFSALHSLNLSGPARRESDFFFAEPLPVERHQNRGLFANIIGQLNSKHNES